MSIIRRWLFALALLILVACGAAEAHEEPLDQGERLFRTWCSGCHMLAPSEGAPQLAPSLAEMAAAARANSRGLSPADYLREGTLNPNATIAPGYSAGLMPTNYAESLSAEEIEALLAFMASQ